MWHDAPFLAAMAGFLLVSARRAARAGATRRVAL
ncbi:hypothetical protein A2U01_0044168, partial [Trifolium medium]|nr:hypothetical protein [Trifolium medium]